MARFVQGTDGIICVDLEMDWWNSLVMQWFSCHCSNLGHCCSMGLIPGLGTFLCHVHSQKRKKESWWQEIWRKDWKGMLGQVVLSFKRIQVRYGEV